MRDDIYELLRDARALLEEAAYDDSLPEKITDELSKIVYRLETLEGEIDDDEE